MEENDKKIKPNPKKLFILPPRDPLEGNFFQTVETFGQTSKGNCELLADLVSDLLGGISVTSFYFVAIKQNNKEK